MKELSMFQGSSDHVTYQTKLGLCFRRLCAAEACKLVWAQKGVFVYILIPLHSCVCDLLSIKKRDYSISGLLCYSLVLLIRVLKTLVGVFVVKNKVSGLRVPHFPVHCLRVQMMTSNMPKFLISPEVSRTTLHDSSHIRKTSRQIMTA